MGEKKLVLFLLLAISIFLISMNFVSAADFQFPFNGTATNEAGTALNNSVVNITVRNMAGWTVVGYNTTTTNASGWFNLSIDNRSALWVYELSIMHRDSTLNYVDYRSKPIPGFPTAMIEMLAGANFYLVPAGTINITAINASGYSGSNISNGSVLFNYQIKDTKLGYPIAESMETAVQEAIINVPSDRNYSIMIYPQNSMPVSFNWDNFTSPTNYTFGQGLSNYNATTKTVTKKFNLTLNMARVTGYSNSSGNFTWSDFTVVPYLLEPGNMVHAEFGDMPYNLSGAILQSDMYNSTGYFNISIPATTETSSVLLFAVGKNNTNFYGGFRNISLSYGTFNATLNFTLYGLSGSPTNITMNRIDGGGGNINISTAKRTFNIVNGSNATLGNTSAHIELTLDYSNSSYNALEFTWMVDISQSQTFTNFSVILLNTTGIKELNIFISGGGPGGAGGQYAPKTISLTQSQVQTNSSIVVSSFNPRDIDGAVASSGISIALYISNSTCDVPNPPSSCVVGSSATMATFNPLRAVMGGGKLSFRMGTGNIFVHYVNVDLLASGPPDVLFDRGANTNGTSGSTFGAALRFGSAGPKIYDYAFVSIPYTESEGTGLNESAPVTMSVPLLYDENWNIIWNTTANGTSANALIANYSHYSGRASEWANLTASSTCTTNATLTSSTQINASKPCFIDTSNNRIWVRIPHFSGTGPSASGSAVAVSTGAATTGGGGGGAVPVVWKVTYSISVDQLEKGYTKELAVAYRIKFKINNTEHYTGIIELTNTTTTINISSTPQQATLSIGDEKKFEVTNDTFYDISVKLNSINMTSKKASVTLKSIHEEMPATSAAEGEEAQNVTEGAGEGEEEGIAAVAAKWWIWVIVAVIVVAIIIVIVVIAKSKKK